MTFVSAISVVNGQAASNIAVAMQVFIGLTRDNQRAAMARSVFISYFIIYLSTLPRCDLPFFIDWLGLTLSRQDLLDYSGSRDCHTYARAG